MSVNLYERRVMLILPSKSEESRRLEYDGVEIKG
jgi:hypothetical protein